MKSNSTPLLPLLAFIFVIALSIMGSSPEARSQEMRTTFAYHDGVPDHHIMSDGDNSALGTFFFPTDSDRLYQVTTFRFYHGYEYPPPQVGYGYRLYLVYRDLADEDYFTVHTYPDTDLPPLSTTCNYCWEELEIPWWGFPVLIGGDTFNDCLGIFIRPEEDEHPPPLADFPFPWIDAVTDFPMTTAQIDFYAYPPNEIYNATYSNVGELLIDIEITYMDETATDETSISKLKRIWSPPSRDK